MLIVPDGTIFIQILNFVVFWALLNYLFIRPTQKAIMERQRHIAEAHGEADALTAQAAQLQAEAEAIRAQAARRAQELLRKAAAEAAAQVKTIERETENTAAQIVAAARSAVEKERSVIVAAQQPFIAELARQMADRATGPVPVV